MVRWGSAQAMAVISHAMDKNTIKDFLLPLLKALLADKNDSVKVHSVQSSVTIAKLLDEPDVI